MIWLYPNGTKIKLGGLFEKFREAWYLLRGEDPPADPAAKIAEISASAWDFWTSGSMS